MFYTAKSRAKWGAINMSVALSMFAAPSVAFADTTGELLPKRQITKAFKASADKAQIALDNAAYAALLDRYLSVSATGITAFDYAAVSAADQQALDAYVAQLTAIDPTQLTRDQQIAYWSNLYNAVTLDVVIDAGETVSIKDIEIDVPKDREPKLGLFGGLKSAVSGGPWDAPIVDVNGIALTLNNIEHEILRKMREPRIHYSINCASYSCPNLKAEPWVAADLDAQLDAAAKAFVQHPRGVRVDADGGLVVSKIYDWFDRDFGGDEAGILKHITSYATGEVATALSKATAIADYEYDWTLNSPANVARLEKEGGS
jgi:hypothetical protein